MAMCLHRDERGLTLLEGCKDLYRKKPHGFGRPVEGQCRRSPYYFFAVLEELEGPDKVRRKADSQRRVSGDDQTFAVSVHTCCVMHYAFESDLD